MDFINFLSVCIYLALIRIVGQIAGLFNCRIIGQIAAGVIVGPYCLNILPFLDAFELLGMFGLTLLVLQGSLGINLDDFSRTSKSAFYTATMGVFLPVLLCGFLIYGYGGNLLVNCFSAAACMASTSIGTASALLEQYSQQKTTIGCLILSAAMLDDVMSLVLLAILSISITSQQQSTAQLTWIVIRPILVSFIMIILTWITIKIIILIFDRFKQYDSPDKNLEVVIGLEMITAPQEKMQSYADDNPLQQIPKKTENTQEKNNSKTFNNLLQSSDVKTSAVLALAVGLASAANYSGTTYLLGIFCAGIIFAPFPSVGERFCHQLGPLLEFLSAMFFGAIGLAIPIRALGDFSTIQQGLFLALMGFVSKWITGFLQYIPNLRVDSLSVQKIQGEINPSQKLIWIEANVIGLAMVSRGEIGYLMALQLFSTNTITIELYGQLMWALTLCTVISPPLFAFALQSRIQKIKYLPQNQL